MKLFVDANTLVSGLVFAGNERSLLELGRLRVCDLVTNTYVMDEVREVLARPHLDLSSDEHSRALMFLAQCVTVLDDPPTETIRSAARRLRDADDLPVLLGFEESRSDYLVTGDRRLRQRVPKSLTTRAALRRILAPVG